MGNDAVVSASFPDDRSDEHGSSDPSATQHAATRHSTSQHSAGLRRDIEVLRELASEESLRRGGLGVVRIAERLGREKSQVSRALRALAAEGLVERDPQSRTYQLGWGLYTLASRGVEARLVRAATSHLHRLAERHRGQVRLCVLIGGQVLSLLTIPAGSTARQDPLLDAGAMPLTMTAAGPALVMDWPEAALRDLLSEPDYVDVAAHVDVIRHHRYVHVQATQAGHGSYAAPIRDFRGIVLAAVELSWPAVESPTVAGAGPAISAAIVNTADALSDELGYDNHPAYG